MITIDDRAGSRLSGTFDFRKHLTRAGVRCRVKRLPFGDFALTGNGPGGYCRVLIERKTVDEIIGAIMDNRFTGRQVPGLLRSSDFPVLVVEGKAWCDFRSGILMNGRREAGRTRQRHLWANYLKFQLTLMFKARLFVWHTSSRSDTVQFLAALHSWFTDKRWAEHKSVYTVDETKPEYAILDVRTLKRRLAAQLPNVEWVRSKKVDQHFPSIAAMFNASVDEWKEALGISTGRKIAKTLYDAIHAEPIEHQLKRTLAMRASKNVVAFAKNKTDSRAR